MITPSKLLTILRIVLNPGVFLPPLRMNRRLKRLGIHRGAASRDNRSSVSTLRWLLHAAASETPTRRNGAWILNSFLPPFPSRAYSGMFEAMTSGRRLSPVSAFLSITSDCMYRCPHCSAKKRPTDNLDSSVWLKVIDSLLNMHCAIIGFTGGEPMLRDELPELIARASVGGAATVLFTTGAGFDGEAARRLANAGLDYVCFSLDASEPDKFNAFRGADTAFSAVECAVSTAKRHGFYTMLGAVATPEFVESGEFVRVHALAESWGVDELRLVEAMPCGNWLDAPESQFLSSAQIKILRAFHCRTNAASPTTKVCAFNEIESPENFGCGGGTQHLYLDSAGNVCPCDFTPLSFGNITKEPFESIWTRMNDAMGEPRRHCFLRANTERIRAAIRSTGEYPLQPETACSFCRSLPAEDLPDYFQITTKRRRREVQQRRSRPV